MKRWQEPRRIKLPLPMLKAKLAKLRSEILQPTTKGAGEGFYVTNSGDARVGLVGFPSVGKSTLLNKLIGTFSKVSPHPMIVPYHCTGAVWQFYAGSNLRIKFAGQSIQPGSVGILTLEFVDGEVF